LDLAAERQTGASVPVCRSGLDPRQPAAAMMMMMMMM
jgi:hypothetical protein